MTTMHSVEKASISALADRQRRFQVFIDGPPSTMPDTFQLFLPAIKSVIAKVQATEQAYVEPFTIEDHPDRPQFEAYAYLRGDCLVWGVNGLVSGEIDRGHA